MQRTLSHLQNIPLRETNGNAATQMAASNQLDSNRRTSREHEQTRAWRAFAPHSKAGGVHQDCLQPGPCTHAGRTPEVRSGTRPSFPALPCPGAGRRASLPRGHPQPQSRSPGSARAEQRGLPAPPEPKPCDIPGRPPNQLHPLLHRWVPDGSTSSSQLQGVLAPSSPSSDPELGTASSVLLLAQQQARQGHAAEERGAARPTPPALSEAGAGARAETSAQRVLRSGCGSRHRHFYGNSLARSRRRVLPGATEQLLQGSCCRRQRHRARSSPRAPQAARPLLRRSGGSGQRKVREAVLRLRAGRRNVTCLCFTRFVFQPKNQQQGEKGRSITAGSSVNAAGSDNEPQSVLKRRRRH